MSGDSIKKQLPPLPSSSSIKDLSRQLVRTIGDVFLSRIDALANWAAANSLWPLSFGISCCAIEMMHAAGSLVDLDSFGSLFRASPRHADLMIVAGTVTHKMLPQIKTLYDQMLSPKWVIAMGNCALNGGIFCESYSVVKNLGSVIPIDEFVCGCPPPPEALGLAILNLQKKIRNIPV
jgi:NADH-quinone oxidoreductase subunit B